jgi:hypothetical protein
VSRKLVAVDEVAVIADYEADVTVGAICAHQVPLTRSTAYSTTTRSLRNPRTRQRPGRR